MQGHLREEWNTTLEGLAVKDRLEGSPDFLEDQQDDDDDDGDDDDEGDGDDKPKKGKVTNRVERQEEEFHRLMEEMDIKLDKEKANDAEVVDGPPLPPPDGEPPDDGPEHYSMGKPGDGIIYLSDIWRACQARQTWTDLIVLVQMVAKKYEGHQGQRAVTVRKNGEHYLPRREMSSFVGENSKKKLRSSRRSS